MQFADETIRRIRVGLSPRGHEVFEGGRKGLLLIVSTTLLRGRQRDHQGGDGDGAEEDGCQQPGLTVAFGGSSHHGF
jgi:hypothetical protein